MSEGSLRRRLAKLHADKAYDSEQEAHDADACRRAQCRRRAEIER